MTEILLVAILTFFAVIALGGAVLAVRAAREQALKTRLHAKSFAVAATAAPGGVGAGPAPADKLVRLVEGIGGKVASKGPSPDLQQKLANAGFHVPTAARAFMGAKISLLVLGAAGAAALVWPLELSVPVKVMLILSPGALLSFVPNLFVNVRRKRRTQEVRHHLPDALDLLEICVSAGMGIDTAWNAVGDKIRVVSSVLADEMALTNLELHLGAPRAAAMRHMAERTDVGEISSLVGVLVQSERFGTSIADAVRTFAKSMREARSTRAEVSAEKMAVKLLFPMVLFIFPALILVAVGPAGIVLADIISAR